MASPERPNIGVIDYGMGNLISVCNAFQFLGAKTHIIHSPKHCEVSDAIVLPGVGAFGRAMERLRLLDLIHPLSDAVMGRQVPFLGICLGMQMLAKSSSEMGDHAGLGWVNGRVEQIPNSQDIRVPHVSWNRLAVRKDSKLFRRLKTQDNFYFDHSYQFTVLSEDIVAYTDYHGAIPAVIERDNIYGTQFHPEKSQRAGLIFLRNFLNLIVNR